MLVEQQDVTFGGIPIEDAIPGTEWPVLVFDAVTVVFVKEDLAQRAQIFVLVESLCRFYHTRAFG